MSVKPTREVRSTQRGGEVLMSTHAAMTASTVTAKSNSESKIIVRLGVVTALSLPLPGVPRGPHEEHEPTGQFGHPDLAIESA